jgi:hypothetical protein
MCLARLNGRNGKWIAIGRRQRLRRNVMGVPHLTSRAAVFTAAFISTFDCKMFSLQPRPKFWQNEPNAGDSSRMANDLAIRRVLEAWAAGRIAALPRLEWASPLFFRCIISGRDGRGRS